MTPEYLRGLIVGGESLDVEFKGEERAPLSDRAVSRITAHGNLITARADITAVLIWANLEEIGYGG